MKCKFLILLFIILTLSYGCAIKEENNLVHDNIFLDGATNEDLEKFNQVKDDGIKDSFQIILPEDDASFPKNFAPPEFEWESLKNKIWLLNLKIPGKKDLLVLTKNNIWRPSQEIWDYIKRNSEGEFSKVIVYGQNGEHFSKSQEIKFRISPFPADQFIVFRIAKYQQILFAQLPSLYYRDISKLDTEVFLKNPGFCFACHVFSEDGEGILFQTRKHVENESIRSADIILTDNGNYTSVLENIGTGILGAWIPGERKVLLSVNDLPPPPLGVLSDRTASTYYSSSSDIVIFDVEKKDLQPLKGASNPTVGEFFPSISLDGKMVSFVILTGEKKEVVIEGKKYEFPQESDIYVVPFNKGKGGEPKPLEGASQKGVREYFQRYSPDGKWVVFNRIEGEGDIFLEPSDLYIISAEGGEPRRLECSKEGVLDSIATWSSNSRWIAFDSRRYNNESRIYIAEIDEEGHSYSPVKLPNAELQPNIAYHQPVWINNKRGLIMLSKKFNEFNNVMEEEITVKELINKEIKNL